MATENREPEDLKSLPVVASSDVGPKDMAGGQDGLDRTPERVRTNGPVNPRTPRRKRISSKNAVKHGFFSKDVISAYRLDPAARDEYSQLVKDLCEYWKPVGASEFIQVELMAAHLFQYRSFRRFERALVLATITPNPDLLYAIWGAKIEMETGENRSGEEAEMQMREREAENRIKEYAKGEIEVCEATHDQIDRWKSEFPPTEHFDKLQRYENHILRNYYRAMSELERQQKMRLGEKVLPRMVVELQND
jgi:hypothetical protein